MRDLRGLLELRHLRSMRVLRNVVLSTFEMEIRSCCLLKLMRLTLYDDFTV